MCQVKATKEAKQAKVFLMEVTNQATRGHLRAKSLLDEIEQPSEEGAPNISKSLGQTWFELPVSVLIIQLSTPMTLKGSPQLTITNNHR